MTNDTHPITLSHTQRPLAVIPLLALLLVFLSSVTHQSVAETRLNYGFVGTLDHLVVTSHNESLRTQPGITDKGATKGGDPDVPLWWGEGLANPGDERCHPVLASRLGGLYLPSGTRFLVPLLRAPPLA